MDELKLILAELTEIKGLQVEMKKDLEEVKKDQAEMKKDLEEVKKDQAEMKKDLEEVKKDQAEMKKDLEEVKKDQAEMKTEMAKMQEEIAEMQKIQSRLKAQITGIQLTLENETNQNIKIIAEAHLDLGRKLDESLKVEQEKEMLLIRVNWLENELRRVKEEVRHLAAS